MGTEISSEMPPAAAAESGRITRPATPADQGGVWKWLPGLYVLRHYHPSWLRSDLVAGLVLTAVLVSVGMGYAEAAGLPAIYGLYATIVPLRYETFAVCWFPPRTTKAKETARWRDWAFACGEAPRTVENLSPGALEAGGPRRR